MIELRLTDSSLVRDNILLLTSILHWFVKTATVEHKDVEVQGVVCVYTQPRYCALVLCEKEFHDKIMKILQQPPEEFVGKYEANIMRETEEPKCVDEEKMKDPT